MRSAPTCSELGGEPPLDPHGAPPDRRACAELPPAARRGPDRVELARCDPRRPVRSWEANPHWIRTVLHQTGGPVPNYLTLSGSGRTVEIGAFLSEEERLELKPELEDALQRLGRPPNPRGGQEPTP